MRSKKQSSKPFVTWPVAGLLVAAAGGGAIASHVHEHGLISTAVQRMDCKVKGNVSIETGERIFHVPGQKYYQQTMINPSYGERWFCSEAEARAAGWRKSKS
ncbi:succinoglycan biosynthesis protein exoi [Tianweitania sp.]|uniref:sunset domain-containing protein n=1 Tax=Tianweitania sp. TaxID=2021634 RepID=UPI003A1033EE